MAFVRFIQAKSFGPKNWRFELLFARQVELAFWSRRRQVIESLVGCCDVTLVHRCRYKHIEMTKLRCDQSVFDNPSFSAYSDH